MKLPESEHGLFAFEELIEPPPSLTIQRKQCVKAKRCDVLGKPFAGLLIIECGLWFVDAIRKVAKDSDATQGCQ